MNTPIAGVFKNEQALTEAADMLRDAGLRRRHMRALSQRPMRGTGLREAARCVCVEHLREPGEVQLRAALRGALWGGLITFLVSTLAAFLLLDGLGEQLLVAAFTWKFGAIVGLYAGMFAGSDRGLEKNMALHYLEHLASERFVLVANARSASLANVRGIFLECGVMEIQDVKGTFEPVVRHDRTATTAK